MQLSVLRSSQSGSLLLFEVALDQRHSILFVMMLSNLFKPACLETVKLTKYTCSAHAVKYVSSSSQHHTSIQQCRSDTHGPYVAAFQS